MAKKLKVDPEVQTRRGIAKKLPVSNRMILAGTAAAGALAGYYIARRNGWNETATTIVAGLAAEALGYWLIGDKVVVDADPAK